MSRRPPAPGTSRPPGDPVAGGASGTTGATGDTDATDATGASAGGRPAGRRSAGAAPTGDDPSGAASFEATVLVLLRHGETGLTGEKRFSGGGAGFSAGAGAGTGAGAASESGAGFGSGAGGGSGGGAAPGASAGADARSDRPDPELSATGVWQADCAARELATRGGVQVVVSSPLARCRRTAEAVAGRLGLDIVIDEGLRETDFGAWEGLTFAEARARHPAAMDAWLGNESAPPPGGESFAEVARRVTACRDALLTAHRGRTVLLVSHVTPIKTLLRLALGAPHAALFRMDLSPASLSEIAYYGDGNASVRHLNGTAHLR